MDFFEDIAVGRRLSLGSHTFTADEIIRFASAFDPHPFHVDPAAAAASHFGGLCASGWHIVAVWMRLNIAAVTREAEARRAAGEPAARLGPSPGFEALAWSAPVYEGDTVTFENEVVALKESRSLPGWGLVGIRVTGRNQRGETVVSFAGRVFWERRAEGSGEPD